MDEGEGTRSAGTLSLEQRRVARNRAAKGLPRDPSKRGGPENRTAPSYAD